MKGISHFEYFTDENLQPSPVCLVARELKSGREIRRWRNEMGAAPPYATDESALFVSYYAPAELRCHLVLGWPMPSRILDLYAEFRCLTNGLPLTEAEREQYAAANAKKNGRKKLKPYRKGGLLDALAYYGLPRMDVGTKTKWRDLVLTGGPWDAGQRAGILDYCADDVIALERLLPAMSAEIDLPRALLRGRYTAAVARMEANGIPIDMEMLNLLRKHWDAIQLKQIEEIDKAYGV